MSQAFSFTSESVAEGHPDKMADQISDAVLEAILRKDPNARVACETLVKTGLVLLAGEITTHANIDFEAVVRQTVIDIGYDHSDLGFDGHTCAVLNVLGKQSPNIALGVDERHDHEQGAGDQGIMFGYASNETPNYMPAPLAYAHSLMQAQAQARKSGQLPWLRPDAKSQVTVRYDKAVPSHIETVVLSTQHSADISPKDLREAVIEEIIKPCLPPALLSSNTVYHINPTGQFIIGGPMGDCGLTGRKIIVDTYGGMAHHGGGAFSGKDPSKVDRSAAYYCRYLSKNLVAAGLAERCEIQISYAIGLAQPISLFVHSFGTSAHSNEQLEHMLRNNFDFRPRQIIEQLKLLETPYSLTARYGHFGREDQDFEWEKLNLVDTFKSLSPSR